MSAGGIVMWMDKRVDDMTREEAIEALKVCGRMLHSAQERTAEAWKFHKEVTDYYRGRASQ